MLSSLYACVELSHTYFLNFRNSPCVAASLEAPLCSRGAGRGAEWGRCLVQPPPPLPCFTVFTPGNAEKVESNGIHEIQAVLQWKRVFNFCLLGSLGLNCNC